MKESLLADELNPLSNQTAFVVDEGESVWLYITSGCDSTIISDCWLFNTVPSKADIDKDAPRHRPPPVVTSFLITEDIHQIPESSDIRFMWSVDAHSVAIMVFDEVLGFIADGEKHGYSRNLARQGPWGNPFDEDRFRFLFQNTDT